MVLCDGRMPLKSRELLLRTTVAASSLILNNLLYNVLLSLRRIESSQVGSSVSDHVLIFFLFWDLSDDAFSLLMFRPCFCEARRSTRCSAESDVRIIPIQYHMCVESYCT